MSKYASNFLCSQRQAESEPVREARWGRSTRSSGLLACWSRCRPWLHLYRQVDGWPRCTHVVIEALLNGGLALVTAAGAVREAPRPEDELWQHAARRPPQHRHRARQQVGQAGSGSGIRPSLPQKPQTLRPMCSCALAGWLTGWLADLEDGGGGRDPARAQQPELAQRQEDVQVPAAAEQQQADRVAVSHAGVRSHAVPRASGCCFCGNRRRYHEAAGPRSLYVLEDAHPERLSGTAQQSSRRPHLCVACQAT